MKTLVRETCEGTKGVTLSDGVPLPGPPVVCHLKISRVPQGVAILDLPPTLSLSPTRT